MLRALVKFVKGLYHVTERDAVIKKLDNTLDTITQHVIPSLKTTLSYYKENMTGVDELPLVTHLNRVGGLEQVSVDGVISKLLSTFTAISKEGSALKSFINKEVPVSVASKSITARTAAALKIVDDYSFMTTYSLDFLLMVLDNERLNSLDSELDKTLLAKRKEVLNGVTTFSTLVGFYVKNNKKTISNLGKISETIIDIDESKFSMLTKVLHKQGKVIDLPHSGFVGNPIYLVRMYLVDQDIAKYETLKEKKKVLEFKILELQSIKNGERNPKLEKQIEYYTDKLEATEYKIRSIEDDD